MSGDRYNLLILDSEHDVRLSHPIDFRGTLFVRANGRRWSVEVAGGQANIVELFG